MVFDRGPSFGDAMQPHFVALQHHRKTLGLFGNAHKRAREVFLPPVGLPPKLRDAVLQVSHYCSDQGSGRRK
tara:strand:+ start:1420 stop:1635 length:216 start_codon:yes stop_codon:yes gene_type:complete